MEDSVPKYDLFQKAYKKLKSTAYYDKTNLHLRDRIAEAENTLNITIEERLKDLHQAFVASDSTKWEEKKEDIFQVFVKNQDPINKNVNIIVELNATQKNMNEINT